MIPPLAKKTYLVFVLFSAAAGLSFCFGHLAGLYYNGRFYTPFCYAPAFLRSAPQYLYEIDHVLWDETTAYARYTQEIRRGEILGRTAGSYRNYVSGSIRAGPLWYRDRSGPILLALLALPFSGSVPAAFIAADFLFPALLTLVVLLFCWELFPDAALAVFAASLVVWFNLWDLVGLLYLHWGAPHYGPIFVRTSYPQVSGIFCVLFLLAILRVRREASPASAAWLAAALVLNFYTYVYSWTFTGSIIAAWLLLLALPLTGRPAAGAHGPRRVAAAISASTLAAVALSFPVWLPIVTRPPQLEDSFLRLGGETTHQPALAVAAVSLAFAALAFLAGRAASATRGPWPRAWLWMIFWLGSLIAMNQQVLTGKRIQPFHYLPNFIGPFTLLFAFDLLVWRLRRWQGPSRRRTAIILAVLGLGFLQCAYRLAQPMREDRTLHRVNPDFRQMTGVLRRPALGPYGFLTNDPFLDEVLPAFLVQQPLQPWRMDPLSNDDISILHHAAAQLLGEIPGHPAMRVQFNPTKVLFVLNRRRRIPEHLRDCQVLLRNADFLVAQAAPCGSP
ncbi:MAG TPA: hypothetical protein VEU62_20020 [Bryobacterales bacterium]|nr:hypothetical protein [Bryobacterales bacterium]